jgi:predicted Zn finger-like uncharacterized protein
MIQCPDAEDIIRLLKKKHGVDYSRVWRINDNTIAVFSFERGLSNSVNLITLDHNKAKESCDITILYAGGADWFDSLAEAEDISAGAADDLVRLAKERDWRISVERARIKIRGSECPNCHSSYVYQEEKVRADGLVHCQNCDKPFMIRE